ncbi:putative AMP-binding enzyme [Ilyonectria sp. MPI-CAGE-AT-0026]|nr:putative AMP-binding enzyme [Ilyonectria sp. MPI-CAGE-AT-0026]
MPLPSTGQKDPASPSNSLSHAQCVSLIRRLVAGLLSAGLKPGDTVCIHSFNSIYVPAICLAIIGAGGTFVGTNPSYTERELTNALDMAEVKFVLSEPEISGSMEKAMTNIGLDVGQKLFLLDHRSDQLSQPRARSWNVLLQNCGQDWIRFDDLKRQTNTVAGFFFSSGTTGSPKCAMVTHRNLVAQHQLFWEPNPRDYKIRTVHVFPMYHIGVFPTIIVSQLKDGREAYIMQRWTLERWLAYHERFNITEIFMAPPMVVQVVMSKMADPDAPEYKYSLNSVRAGCIGAAPLSSDMQKRFHQLLNPSAHLTQIWGMTETTSHATSVSPEMAELSWGSIGKPLPNVEMKLIDQDGNDVTHTGRGEACIKGPIVIPGYLKSEEANRESWDAEGYFKTGDVMQMDQKSGLLYVTERSKELLKVRGFQVAPAELEGVLTSHPDITDAAVIGVPDVRSGELPKAYIVLREGSSLTRDQIKAFVKDRLASYKSLEGGITFVPEIPKLPSGKILKRVIREWAEQERQGSTGSKL